MARGTLFHVHGCAAGWRLLYVKPNGDVWPCPLLPISGGNLRERGLRETYRDSDILRKLTDRNQLEASAEADLGARRFH